MGRAETWACAKTVRAWTLACEVAWRTPPTSHFNPNRVAIDRQGVKIANCWAQGGRSVDKTAGRRVSADRVLPHSRPPQSPRGCASPNPETPLIGERQSTAIRPAGQLSCSGLARMRSSLISSRVMRTSACHPAFVGSSKARRSAIAKSARYSASASACLPCAW
jgi:hypothetical protein